MSQRRPFNLSALIIVISVLASLVIGSVLAEGTANQILPTPEGRQDQIPAISSVTNGKIAFTARTMNGNRIFVMNPDGSGQTPLTNFESFDPAFSPDGSKIAFATSRDTSDGRAQLYVMNADGSNQVRLTNDANDEEGPFWSPDGTKIGFTRFPSASNGFLDPTAEIYTMNANGSNQIRLTNNTDFDDFASFSPDGTKILFNSFRGGRVHIYVMNPDGTGQTQLSQSIPGNPDEATPAWSPDGTKIVHARGDINNLASAEIYVMNANGSNPLVLTTNTYPDILPTWSPDGTKIAFQGFPSDPNLETGAVYSMNANGSNPVALTGMITEGSRMSWAPAPATPAATIQFSATNYNGGEGDGSIIVTVNRSGDSSGVSTVDFASSNGTASQLRDYEVANGTLTFAAGQTSRTFRVLVVDDVYAESNETVNLTLSNPVGGSLTAPTTATVTIVDNDSGGSTSPTARQFVSNLTGADEVPATPNTVKGNGGIVQLSTDELSAKVSLLFSGLTGSETGAHVHAGAPGVNGPIIFPLPLGNPINNFVVNPTAQQVADLRAGQQYMNVHSSGFLNGEIRGQLLWNPAEEADFFVRQAYFDFLSRVPDTSGFNFWVGEITNCQSDVECLRRKRVDVSNAFFYEQEFQQTAAYVLRLYRGAYGNNQPFPNPNPNAGFPNEEKKLPSYAVFVADRARVIGGSNLAQKQLDLANLFVTRPEFLTKYPASLATADQFVDALLLTLQNDLGVNLSGQRANLINIYNTQGGRGAVLYRLSDDNAAGPVANQPFIDEEYNRSFVLGQYFGYLRRNPDIPGFVFWLGQVNGAPLRNVAKQHAMVCSFITAAEFQLRFGPVASRNNNECPQ